MGEAILDLEDTIRRLEADCFKMEREIRASKNDAKQARAEANEAILKHQEICTEIEELRAIYRNARVQAEKAARTGEAAFNNLRRH